MNVITLKQHRYQGKLKGVGDEYNFIGKQQRRLAIALGWVQVVPRVEKVAEPVKAMSKVLEPKAQELPAEQPFEDVIKPKRTYTRRNLTAEE